MKLTKLTVHHVRTHRSAQVVFSDAVTLITGKNGSGKTSLLESVYLSLRGKSFKSSDDTVLRDGADWYRIDLETTSGLRSVVYDIRTAQKKKTHTIDRKTYLRLPERLKYPVVLFEPDDLMMVTGGPSLRREYIDTIIAQYDSHYARLLRQYERALAQRNKLLKQEHVTRDMVFSWNVLLSRHGAAIIAQRQELIEALNQSLRDVYAVMSASTDDVAISYDAHHASTTEQLLREYELQFERDRLLRMTTVGPHRHDISILLNTHPAQEVGSRGENRTIVLALKFIEAHQLEARTGQKPLILLDDVFGELDDSRQQLLLREFRDNQIIMTSASVKGRPPRGTITL